MSTTGMGFDEVMESITGFDEIAIEKHFGIDMYTDGERKPMLVTRAAVFVHLKHNGMNDLDARQEALGMSVKAVGDYFDLDDAEVMPDEPVTAVGKDDTQPAAGPSGLPTSAPSPAYPPQSTTH